MPGLEMLTQAIFRHTKKLTVILLSEDKLSVQCRTP